MTTQLLAQALQDYSEAFTSPEPPMLARLRRETHLKVEMPVMLSGHLQGAFLQMISLMIQPERILEIGTYTGYSAIYLAQGLRPSGVLHTIEANEELQDICYRYICSAGLKDKIVQHIGKGVDVIPKLEETFDLVFIDADKQNYELYLNLVADKVRRNGWIIADNVLYNGEVVLPDDQQSKNARAMHAFNQKVRSEQRWERLLLPLRDGLMILRKVDD